MVKLGDVYKAMPGVHYVVTVVSSKDSLCGMCELMNIKTSQRVLRSEREIQRYHYELVGRNVKGK